MVLQKLMMKPEEEVITTFSLVNPETSCVFSVVYSNYIVTIIFSFCFGR